MKRRLIKYLLLSLGATVLAGCTGDLNQPCNEDGTCNDDLWCSEDNICIEAPFIEPTIVDGNVDTEALFPFVVFVGEGAGDKSRSYAWLCFASAVGELKKRVQRSEG